MTALWAPNSGPGPSAPGWAPRQVSPSSRRGQSARICARVFLVWLLLRTTAWALVAFSQPNPSPRLVEWLCQAEESRTSGLTGMLAAETAAAVRTISPDSFAGFYLLLHLAAALALAGIWWLAQRLFPPRVALAAVLSCDLLLSLAGAQPDVAWPAAAALSVCVLLPMVKANGGRLRLNDTGSGWRWCRLLWACSACGVFGLAVAGGYPWPGSSAPSPVCFCGKALADEVCERYRSRHGHPPAVIAGDPWLAGNVCCRAGHHPRLRGWDGLADLRREGGVLLWDAERQGEELPPSVLRRLAGAQTQRSLLIPVKGCRPQRIGWAFLPPPTRILRTTLHQGLPARQPPATMNTEALFPPG